MIHPFISPFFVLSLLHTSHPSTSDLCVALISIWIYISSLFVRYSPRAIPVSHRITYSVSFAYT